MNPAVVLGMLAGLGGEVDRVLVVGCQPAVIEEGIGLSTPVAAAVDRAVDAVLEVARRAVRHRNEERSARVIRRLFLSALLVAMAAVRREVASRRRPVPEDAGDVGMVSSAAVTAIVVLASGGIVVAVTALPDVNATGGCGRCSSGVARYRIVPGRSRSGSSRSTLHPSTPRPTGSRVARPRGAPWRPGRPRRGAERQLVAAGRAAQSGNPLEDRELRRRIDARRFPTIDGDLT